MLPSPCSSVYPDKKHSDKWEAIGPHYELFGGIVWWDSLVLPFFETYDTMVSGNKNISVFLSIRTVLWSQRIELHCQTSGFSLQHIECDKYNKQLKHQKT